MIPDGFVSAQKYCQLHGTQQPDPFEALNAEMWNSAAFCSLQVGACLQSVCFSSVVKRSYRDTSAWPPFKMPNSRYNQAEGSCVLSRLCVTERALIHTCRQITSSRLQLFKVVAIQTQEQNVLFVFLKVITKCLLKAFYCLFYKLSLCTSEVTFFLSVLCFKSGKGRKR